VEADEVQSSRKLLERMARRPEEVLEALDPLERRSLLSELDVLADQAASVQSEEDLSRLSDAIHRLFARIPALSQQEVGVAEPPRQRVRRKITVDYDEKAYRIDSYRDTKEDDEVRRRIYAMQHAAQIRNFVVESRLRLEKALQQNP
jgi:hypothetical protein